MVKTFPLLVFLSEGPRHERYCVAEGSTILHCCYNSHGSGQQGWNFKMEAPLVRLDQPSNPVHTGSKTLIAQAIKK